MDTLSEDIALIRKCAGSPAYIGPEANRVVEEYLKVKQDMDTIEESVARLESEADKITKLIDKLKGEAVYSGVKFDLLIIFMFVAGLAAGYVLWG